MQGGEKMGEIENAQEKLTESREHLKIAHQHHTKILQYNFYFIYTTIIL